MPRPPNPDKITRAKELLKNNSPFDKIRKTLKSEFGSSLSMTTLTELKNEANGPTCCLCNKIIEDIQIDSVVDVDFGEFFNKNTRQFESREKIAHKECWDRADIFDGFYWMIRNKLEDNEEHFGENKGTLLWGALDSLIALGEALGILDKKYRDIYENSASVQNFPPWLK